MESSHPAMKLLIKFSRDSMQTQSPTILVVDDDIAVCEAVSFLIQSFGWRVRTYTSAEDFLNAYVPEHDHSCLVLDLHMPGMNGVELQDQLKRRGIDLPIVIITAHNEDTLAKRARDAGAMAILSKPFKDEVLLDSIRKALGNGFCNPTTAPSH